MKQGADWTGKKFRGFQEEIKVKEEKVLLGPLTDLYLAFPRQNTNVSNIRQVD